MKIKTTGDIMTKSKLGLTPGKQGIGSRLKIKKKVEPMQQMSMMANIKLNKSGIFGPPSFVTEQ